MLSPVDSFLVLLKKLVIVIILAMAGMDASALSGKSLVKTSNGLIGYYYSGNSGKIAQSFPALMQNGVDEPAPETSGR